MKKERETSRHVTIPGRQKERTVTPVSTPLDPNVKLIKCAEDADLSEMKKIPYQAIIGSLMYAALGTRPDIAL